jgi:hypothetical protein
MLSVSPAQLVTTVKRLKMITLSIFAKQAITAQRVHPLDKLLPVPLELTQLELV